MNPDPQQVETLFAALEKPAGAERATYLNTPG
jgi:hypothetical protein